MFLFLEIRRKRKFVPTLLFTLWNDWVESSSSLRAVFGLLPLWIQLRIFTSMTPTSVFILPLIVVSFCKQQILVIDFGIRSNCALPSLWEQKQIQRWLVLHPCRIQQTGSPTADQRCADTVKLYNVPKTGTVEKKTNKQTVYLPSTPSIHADAKTASSLSFLI